MSIRTLAVFFWGCLVAAAAVAGEKHETRIEIAIDDDGGEPHVFEWHSNDPDSDLSKLEVGESRTLAGEDGEDVVVTRTENGLEFDIDGEKVEVLHDADEMMDKVHDMDGERAVFVKKSKDVEVIEAHGRHEKKIIIKREIEETTD